MKILLLILLTLSFNVFAENPPPANAFRGTVYGYEVAIYQEIIFGSEYGLRTIYKSGSEWLYITEPSFYPSDVDTKAKADAKFSSMISMINTAIYNELNPITLEPVSGFERIKWLLESKLSVIDNEIIISN